MVAERLRRNERSGRLVPDEPPDVVFEVRIAEGAEAERLRVEQARVLWEVMEWVAQRRSMHGQDHAA
ncbi:hypothetical protein SAMN05421810_102544 [Amycolatopsis arida]|uniref:Uncharacterized protein n=2 Tax=Amycolatopsis arida TaxID=587909 RepID=A0A1I5Q8S8_9PSEU|nr:hypothetical protein CLV69_101545 [Amycolatopsis arida]SFP42460.1 hypothetical protein SAMN05421810_102544 [Amycolatopsis arida]